MNKRVYIKKIKEIAQQDKRRRLDSRYLKVMGFLVAKGFLYINKKIHLNPNGHINLKDAIWAGRFVEPRILEVLPAAYERFKRHFSGDAETVEKLEQIIDMIKQKSDHKIEFYEISIEKIRPWFFIRLRDGRSKSLDDRSVTSPWRSPIPASPCLRSTRFVGSRSCAGSIAEFRATGPARCVANAPLAVAPCH